MAADSFNPAGIYFGTRSGKIYGSNNEGNSWQLLVEGLPAVTCVKAAMVGEPRAAMRSRTAKPVKSAANKTASSRNARRK
jgi:hypothetical protein